MRHLPTFMLIVYSNRTDKLFDGKAPWRWTPRVRTWEGVYLTGYVVFVFEMNAEPVDEYLLYCRSSRWKQISCIGKFENSSNSNCR